MDIDKVIDAYNDYLVAVESFKKSTDSSILYKLMAFDVIQMISNDLQEQLLTAQEILHTYGYEK